MAPAVKGDLSLNGKEYRIVLDSYRKNDIVDFAPRAATPGGSILHSELGLYQPLLQSDWRHGFGHPWYDDAQGYMRTEGNVDARNSGAVMLMTQHSTGAGGGAATNVATGGGFLNFNGYVYAWGTAGLWQYTGGTWTNRDASNIVMAFATGTYIFFNAATTRLKKLSTANVVSNAGTNAQTGDFGWGLVAGGRIYLGKRLQSRVHHDNQDDLSGLEGSNGTDEGLGVATADPDLIPVGNGGWAMLGAIVYAGKVYIFKPDGIYNLDTASHIATKVLDFPSEVSSTNFASFAVHNGFLVFPIRDRLYQWNGVRLADITPPQISDIFPYNTYGRFDNLVPIGRYLFLTARTNDTTWKEDILAFDGVSWFQMPRIITNGTDTISSMGYDVTSNRLWLQVDAATDAIYFIPFQNLSEYPYSNFDLGAGHAWYSSRWDMGFRRVVKSSPSILVEGHNLTAARYLLVSYAIDGGAFTVWGTDGKVTANGVTELLLTTSSGTIEYKHIQIKVQLKTDDAAQTPIMESITLRFIMRPEVSYGWSFTIIGAQHPRYGNTQIYKTAKVIADELETARDSKSPIDFIDLWGVTHKVYVSSIMEQAVERHVDSPLEGGFPNIEQTIRVTVVEVG